MRCAPAWTLGTACLWPLAVDAVQRGWPLSRHVPSSWGEAVVDWGSGLSRRPVQAWLREKLRPSFGAVQALPRAEAQLHTPCRPAGTRSWAPRFATSASLARCWRRCGTRARWWPSPRVSPVLLPRCGAGWRTAATPGGGVAGAPCWGRVAVNQRCSLCLGSCAGGQRRVLACPRVCRWCCCRSRTHSPALLPRPAADKLEAAHAERPGFFAAVKKVV